jgi:hypothetical protein
VASPGAAQAPSAAASAPAAFLVSPPPAKLPLQAATSAAAAAAAKRPRPHGDAEDGKQGVKKNAPTTSAADMKSPLPLLLSSPAALALSPLALTSPLPPQPPQLCLFHRCRPSSRCRLGPLLCCGVPRRRPSSLSCRLSPRSFPCFTAAGQAAVAGGDIGGGGGSGGSGSGEKWPVPHSTVNKPSSVRACLRAWQSTKCVRGMRGRQRLSASQTEEH